MHHDQVINRLVQMLAIRKIGRPYLSVCAFLLLISCSEESSTEITNLRELPKQTIDKDNYSGLRLKIKIIKDELMLKELSEFNFSQAGLVYIASDKEVYLKGVNGEQKVGPVPAGGREPDRIYRSVPVVLTDSSVGTWLFYNDDDIPAKQNSRLEYIDGRDEKVAYKLQNTSWVSPNFAELVIAYVDSEHLIYFDNSNISFIKRTASTFSFSSIERVSDQKYAGASSDRIFFQGTREGQDLIFSYQVTNQEIILAETKISSSYRDAVVVRLGSSSILFNNQGQSIYFSEEEGAEWKRGPQLFDPEQGQDKVIRATSFEGRAWIKAQTFVAEINLY
jgi:hypothetical protein